MNSLKIHVTRRKLIKIFNNLRNNKFKLKIVYENNKSSCMRERREYIGIIDNFGSYEFKKS